MTLGLENAGLPATSGRVRTGHRGRLPLDVSDVEILTYASHANLMDKTKTAITCRLVAGFKKDMISVVTYRGREMSKPISSSATRTSVKMNHWSGYHNDCFHHRLRRT